MMATVLLRQQRAGFFTQLWQGAALAALGLWGSAMALPLGTGLLLARHRTAEMAIPLFCSGIFLLVALAGLRWMISGGLGCLPGHTPLGCSLQTQRNRGERLFQLIQEVDADVGLAAGDCGALTVGNRWVLGQEAMRIDHIQGIFLLEGGGDELTLCLVDGNHHEQSVFFAQREQMEKAVGLLRQRLPGAAFGDAEAYMAYTVRFPFHSTGFQLKPYGR